MHPLVCLQTPSYFFVCNPKKPGPRVFQRNAAKIKKCGRTRSTVTMFCTFIERTLEPSKQYIEKRHKVIQKKNELTGTKKNPRYISVCD